MTLFPLPPVRSSPPPLSANGRAALTFHALGSFLIATLLLALPLSPLTRTAAAQAAADEAVRPKGLQSDWTQARQAAERAIADPASRSTQLESAQQAGATILDRLNTALGRAYPGAGNIPVPVLAPLDQRQLLTATDAQGANSSLRQNFSKLQLIPNRNGYDIIATVSDSLLRDLNIKTSEQPQIHIAGSSLSYDDAPAGTAATGISDRFTDLRRQQSDDELTYQFKNFGLSYFANLSCTSGPPYNDSLSCADADRILKAALNDLAVVGGREPVSGLVLESISRAKTVKRPTAISPDFKYHPPGRLLPGTSATGTGGATSRKIYGNDLLFPIAEAPVFANSQAFMHWGECLGKANQIDLPEQPGDKFDRYKCKQTPNTELLRFEGHPDNYSYPWYDNYCEDRAQTGAHGCPKGKGHKGQDLRPARCEPAPGKPAQCKIDVFDVVAVTDGCAWWKTGRYENHVRLNTDDGTGLYYMYLHISPEALTRAGLKRGECVPVKRGKKIGEVGDYWFAKADGTTTHLHFEIRTNGTIGVPQPPYMTLVRAYERLINAQGVELP